MNFELEGKRVYVAGHRGMVGSALVRRLASENCELVTAGRETVDLRNQKAVYRWFGEHRPDAVFLAAARVGGIRRTWETIWRRGSPGARAPAHTLPKGVRRIIV